MISICKRMKQNTNSINNEGNNNSTEPNEQQRKIGIDFQSHRTRRFILINKQRNQFLFFFLSLFVSISCSLPLSLASFSAFSHEMYGNERWLDEFSARVSAAVFRLANLILCIQMFDYYFQIQNAANEEKKNRQQCSQRRNLFVSRFAVRTLNHSFSISSTLLFSIWSVVVDRNICFRLTNRIGIAWTKVFSLSLALALCSFFLPFYGNTRTHGRANGRRYRCARQTRNEHSDDIRLRISAYAPA